MTSPTTLAIVGIVAVVLGILECPTATAGGAPDTRLVSTASSGGNEAFGASFVGASLDGSRVFFETAEPLVAGDSDTTQDVYLRASGDTTLVSTAPSADDGSDPAFFAGASGSGARVFFTSRDRLLPADADGTALDIYAFDVKTGTTTLVSPGGNADFDVSFEGSSVNGSRVFFDTKEPLVAKDTDRSVDVYQRSLPNGGVALLSVGPASADGAFDAHFADASKDGARVFFDTAEALIRPDTNGEPDVYRRAHGETTLISTGPSGSEGGASLVGLSDNGSVAFLQTTEGLLPEDSDGNLDVYARSGDSTTLVSTNGTGRLHPDARFAGASADGSRVFFQTTEQLVAGDTDDDLDVYMRKLANTNPVLVSTASGGSGGSFRDASSDGLIVFFETTEPLLPADQDRAYLDIYVRDLATNRTSLVSTGPLDTGGGHNAVFSGASTDGLRVFFETRQQLVSDDTDPSQDVYMHSGGVTTLVSAAPGGSRKIIDSHFTGASDDGTRVFFETSEAMVAADSDDRFDVYERRLPR